MNNIREDVVSYIGKHFIKENDVGNIFITDNELVFSVNRFTSDISYEHSRNDYPTEIWDIDEEYINFRDNVNKLGWMTGEMDEPFSSQRTYIRGENVSLLVKKWIEEQK